MKRVFVIVLDSFGIGAMPDANRFGDENANTLKSVSRSKFFKADNLKKLGLFNIDGVSVGEKTDAPAASYGRLSELSNGKDTTTGHWEMTGLVSDKPMPTYPDGFPDEIIKEFENKTGRRVLCNRPYSGTDVIRDYGKEHLETGALIVYTSADSVFQIAAHEDKVPLETLYDYCRIAREMLTGKHSVGRVIARPFTGKDGNFTRTGNRRDFSLKPFAPTMLDELKSDGFDVIAVGKITDIFAGEGITESVFTHSNAEGMEKTLTLAKKDFNGLCFVNLVDFDSMYGHRNDADGYAKAISEFDEFLPKFLPLLKDDDALIITADHGCDPGDESTDHTREYVPFLLYSKSIKPQNLGTRAGFAHVGQTVKDLLCDTDKKLCDAAVKAKQNSYSPYSGFKVGAALLCKDGSIFAGCNIENASFSPTVCAERNAIFKAVSEGYRDFVKIAVAGSNKGGITPPCGVCRQVMSEFCSPDFEILLVTDDGYEKYTLKDMLPLSFGLEK